MRIRTIGTAFSATLLALTCASFASAASAQSLTRAEVRQQLIEAEANGSQFVTDASYPDVSPVFAQQVAHAKQAEGYGPATSGSSAAGGVPPAHASHNAPGACVGPVSFCTLYFGS
jgi:hypothetical protein